MAAAGQDRARGAFVYDRLIAAGQHSCGANSFIG